MAYINHHVKPQITGCTIYNDDREGESWVARYQLIPGIDTTKTKSYIDKKGRRIEGKNSRNCLNWVLHWAWECHTAATGQPCPWDFTPRCADWTVTFTEKPLAFGHIFVTLAHCENGDVTNVQLSDMTFMWNNTSAPGSTVAEEFLRLRPVGVLPWVFVRLRPVLWQLVILFFHYTKLAFV